VHGSQVVKKVNPLCGLDPYDATALIEQVRPAVEPSSRRQ